MERNFMLAIIIALTVIACMKGKKNNSFTGEWKAENDGAEYYSFLKF